MDAIDILVNEHGLIRQFLDNIYMALEKLEMDERPPREFFDKALEFSRNFTDKFHHFKEEYVMFGQLAQRKSGALDGQLDSLRHQHERNRNFIAEISDSLDGYAKGDEIPTDTLIESLAAYISLLRNHIHREDHKFYPMVREEFSEDELQGLLDLFNKENQRIGEQTFEENRKLVQEMAALL